MNTYVKSDQSIDEIDMYPYASNNQQAWHTEFQIRLLKSNSLLENVDTVKMQFIFK